jgi:hypothetical protein
MHGVTGIDVTMPKTEPSGPVLSLYSDSSRHSPHYLPTTTIMTLKQNILFTPESVWSQYSVDHV